MWDTGIYISSLVLGLIFSALGFTALAVVAGFVCGALWIISSPHATAL